MPGLCRQSAAGQLAVAIIFLCVGVTPLYALSLIYGAIVLRFKRRTRSSRSRSRCSRWRWDLLSVTVLPGSYAGGDVCPAHVDDERMRAALLDTGYILGRVAARYAVLAAMCLIGPPLAFAIFRRTERSLQRGAGVAILMNKDRPLHMTNPSLHAPRSTLYSFLAMVRVQTILISRYPANLQQGCW